MNKYDHIGRIKQGTAGVFARGETYTPGEQTAPYTKTYNYDVFGNLKGDVGGYWGFTTNTYDYTFNTQNRVTAQTYNGDSIDPSRTWQYDADGRATRSYDELFNHGEQLYDAAGNLTKLTDYGYSTTKWSETYLIQDGNGLVGKKSQRYTTDNGATWTNNPTGYYITSSVFGGQVITEANATGKKLKTNIIAANREIAAQKITYDENGVITEQQVEWKNYDAFGVSDLRTRKKANETAVTGMDFATMELDPVGLEVRSRQTNQGGGGTIDPEIPMLQNLPEPGAPGGDPDYYGTGSGGIGALCDIGGPVAVLCGRIQFVDGFGRSGRFASLERNFYFSNQPTGYQNHRRELVTNSGIYGGGRPPANARYGSDGESYLLGYETWTTAIYSNWSAIASLATLAGRRYAMNNQDHHSSSKVNDEKKRWTIIKQTVSNVLSRLENNSECLKTINHNGYDLSPAVALKRIFDRGSFPYDKDIEYAAQTYEPKQLDNGEISLGSSFFKKTIIDGIGINWNKVTGLNRFKIREFIILHELRHIYGSKHEEEGSFEKDITKILKDCFGVTPDLSQFK